MRSLRGLELFAGGLSRLDDLAEAHLVGLGEQRKAPGLVEIEAEQVGAGAHGAPRGSAAREITHCKLPNAPAGGLFRAEPVCGVRHTTADRLFYPLSAKNLQMFVLSAPSSPNLREPFPLDFHLSVPGPTENTQKISPPLGEAPKSAVPGAIGGPRRENGVVGALNGTGKPELHRAGPPAPRWHSWPHAALTVPHSAR